MWKRASAFPPLLLLTDIKVKNPWEGFWARYQEYRSSLGFPTDKMGQGLNVSSAFGDSKCTVAFMNY